MDLHASKLKEFGTLGFVALGVALIGLVLLGIGGTIYKVIGPDGWLESAFQRGFASGFAVLGALGAIVLLAWYSRGWSKPVVRNRVADLLVYALASAGLVYMLQLFVKGTL